MSLKPKPLAERFWPKVNKTDSCWEWTSAMVGNGYGMFTIKRGVTVLAHRQSYEFSNGPIPEGMQVDHQCFNRACVNPSHLRLVTSAGNSQSRKGANAGSSSGYRGVSWQKQVQKWQATAVKNGKKYSAGLFADPEDAAKAAEELRVRIYERPEVA